MTREEFKSHDWKIGEILYIVGYRRCYHFSIPTRVIRAKLVKNEDGWRFMEACNKKYHEMMPFYGFKTYDRAFCEVFFNKDDAQKRLEEKIGDFKKNHLVNFRDFLVSKLYELDKEKNRILNRFKLEIFY